MSGVLRLPGNAHHPSVDLRFILPLICSSCPNWVMLADDVTLSPMEVELLRLLAQALAICIAEDCDVTEL